MKINQRIIVILLIGVFLVAAVFLYMNYTKQVAARDQAQQELNQANVALTKSTKDKSAAQLQLDQANNEIAQLENQMENNTRKLEEVKSSVPSAADSVDYDETFFDIARRYNVTVLGISTGKNSESKLDNVTFSTTTFQVSVKGTITDVLNYLYALSTESPFDYATISSLGIAENQETIVTTDAEGNEIETTYTYEQMDIQVTMYTYGG